MDTISDLMKLASGFGSAAPVIALLVWLYYNERKERVELAGKVLTITMQGIEASKDMTRAVEMLTLKVGQSK